MITCRLSNLRSTMRLFLLSVCVLCVCGQAPGSQAGLGGRNEGLEYSHVANCSNEAERLCAEGLLDRTCAVRGHVGAALHQLDGQRAQIENAMLLAASTNGSVEMLERKHELVMTTLLQLQALAISACRNGASRLEETLEEVATDTATLQSSLTEIGGSLLIASSNIAAELQQEITVVGFKLSSFLLHGPPLLDALLREEAGVLKTVERSYVGVESTAGEIITHTTAHLTTAVSLHQVSRSWTVLDSAAFHLSLEVLQLSQLMVLSLQEDIVDAAFNSQRALEICSQIQEMLELGLFAEKTLSIFSQLTETENRIAGSTLQGNQNVLLLKELLRSEQDISRLFAKFEVCVKAELSGMRRRVQVIEQHARSLRQQLLSTNRVAAVYGFPHAVLATSMLSEVGMLALQAISLSDVAVPRLHEIPEYAQSLAAFMNSLQLLSAARLLTQVSVLSDRVSVGELARTAVVQESASLCYTLTAVGERFAPLHEAVSVTARAARLSYNTLLGNNFQLVFLLREAAPALASAIEGSSLAAAAAEEVLNRTAQVSFEETAGGLSLLPVEAAALLQEVAGLEPGIAEALSLASAAESIVNRAFQHFNQLQLPVMFAPGGSVLSVGPQASGEGGGDFRSLLLTLPGGFPSGDEVMAHVALLCPLSGQNVTLTVGSLSGRVFAGFAIAGPLSQTERTNLILSASGGGGGGGGLSGHYSIEITRTVSVVRLYLHDLEAAMSVSTSAVISSRLLFHLEAGFSSSARLHIGGATLSSSIQSTVFADAANFTGCMTAVAMNSRSVPLWTTRPGGYAPQPCTGFSCRSDSLTPQPLALNGSGFAQTELTGVVFPLRLSFQTVNPNGLLLFAQSRTEVSSLLICLLYGNIVVTVSAGNRRRTLTSSQTYASGTEQQVTLSLSPSHRSLVLTSAREETTKGLQFIETASVLNYTELYVGGVGLELSAGIRNYRGNFIGCLAVSLLSARCDQLPLSCKGETGAAAHSCTGSCLKQEGVQAASFFGASFTSSPAITPGPTFELSLSFLTVFPDALLVYSGNASEGAWFAVSIISGRLSLQFGSVFGQISLLVTRPEVNVVDGRWHTLAVTRVSFRLDIYLDGANALSSFFGSIFPSVPLSTPVFIGGVPPSLREVVRFGVDTAGFIGSLDDVYVVGRRLDFLRSVWSEQVTLSDVPLAASGWRDVYSFNGTGFAEFELGRFQPDFSVGFQFNTLNATGLLLYLYSRRRPDAIAVQITQRTAYVWSEEGVVYEVTSSGLPVADGRWHAVILEKSGGLLTLAVNGSVVGQASGLPTLIRTNSPLFIGGLPAERRHPLPDVLTPLSFSGRLRMSYLSHATTTLSQVQPAAAR